MQESQSDLTVWVKINRYFMSDSQIRDWNQMVTKHVKERKILQNFYDA
jgi:hypothetical protein